MRPSTSFHQTSEQAHAVTCNPEAFALYHISATIVMRCDTQIEQRSSYVRRSTLASSALVERCINLPLETHASQVRGCSHLEPQTLKRAKSVRQS
jgi:hypothetical protein